MITLKIGNEERRNGNIEEKWIAQQIRKRREDGNPICVQAVINHGVPAQEVVGVAANPIAKNRSFLIYGTKEA